MHYQNKENYEPYHENEFMFIFSNDGHENMSILSNIYSTEYTRIETLNVYTEEKEPTTWHFEHHDQKYG